VANTPSKSSLSKVLETSCSGFSISASIKSPSLESSSFPIGVSYEIGSCALLAINLNFSIVISILSAISSSLGFLPNSWLRTFVVFLILDIVSYK